jgi:hypothetical protein
LFEAVVAARVTPALAPAELLPATEAATEVAVAAMEMGLVLAGMPAQVAEDLPLKVSQVQAEVAEAVRVPGLRGTVREVVASEAREWVQVAPLNQGQIWLSRMELSWVEMAALAETMGAQQ